jgi:flagellar hook protein FlgE
MALPETLTASTSTELGTTTANYNFGSSSDTVDTGTNMTISVATDSGTSTITAPTVTAGETIAEYQTALQQALSDAGVTGVTVSLDAGGTGLSISGTGVSVSGSVIQDCTGSSNTSGTLNFDSNGNLVSPSADISKIAFSGLADGASSLDMTWNLYKSSGSGYLTQTASTSTTSAGSQDGYPAGSYSSYSIGSGGEVSVTYSNGENQVVGQLAVAAVSDEEALTSAGSTNYETTAASGSATIGVAGTGGRGTLEGSSLEASNVSVSTEFSNLIIYQRAYEANAKALTTFDTVTQDTINIIRS